MEHFPEPNPTPIHAARGKDCFISYSRRDKTFLERLFAALAAANFAAWVDWEDIPRGEHFLREIYGSGENQG